MQPDHQRKEEDKPKVYFYTNRDERKFEQLKDGLKDTREFQNRPKCIEKLEGLPVAKDAFWKHEEKEKIIMMDYMEKKLSKPLNSDQIMGPKATKKSDYLKDI